MKQVLTIDTQRDITKIVEDASNQQSLDPVALLGGAIAESGLAEHAVREQAWPDVSYGLWQPAVAFLGGEVAGLTRTANGMVADTPSNRAAARAFCFDAGKLAGYTAARYAALVQRWGSPLEAWCRYNSPALPGSQNPYRHAYELALIRAEAYRTDGQPRAIPEPEMIMKGAFAANFAAGRQEIKPEAVVLHIAEGPLGAVDSWFNVAHPANIGPTSAHFCVAVNGEIHQYVDVQDTAFANGIVEAGHTAQLITDNEGINPNLWTVSIEHAGVHGDPVPPAQFDASTRLTAWLFQDVLLHSGATDVAVDRTHILRHADISPQSRALCPSWSEAFIAQYIARVQALLA